MNFSDFKNIKEGDEFVFIGVDENEKLTAVAVAEILVGTKMIAIENGDDVGCSSCITFKYKDENGNDAWIPLKETEIEK